MNSDTVERDYSKNRILRVLTMTGWKTKGRMGAAEILGLRPPTLYSKFMIPNIRRK
jgi:hypothetical protein